VSAQSLILKLEKLLGLNRQLYQLAQTKTEALKTENLTVLQQTLKQEQIYVHAIKQVEKERIDLASAYLNREDDLTLSACIEKAAGADKENFSDLFQSLTEVMEKLKHANKLNQQLTIQALQFVSLSMDMLMPKEQSPAYRPPGGTATAPKRRSLFDSKA
jgi:flagellar biosynthesis/type III secretory pathway chaperone